MKIWLIMMRADDGYSWLQAAWDDDSTAENHEGWKEEVEKARKLTEGTGYEMRICSITVPGLLGVFDLPDLEGSLD